jgi:hypothetical protein
MTGHGQTAVTGAQHAKARLTATGIIIVKFIAHRFPPSFDSMSEWKIKKMIPSRTIQRIIHLERPVFTHPNAGANRDRKIGIKKTRYLLSYTSLI